MIVDHKVNPSPVLAPVKNPVKDAPVRHRATKTTPKNHRAHELIRLVKDRDAR